MIALQYTSLYFFSCFFERFTAIQLFMVTVMFNKFQDFMCIMITKSLLYWTMNDDTIKCMNVYQHYYDLNKNQKTADESIYF